MLRYCLALILLWTVLARGQAAAAGGEAEFPFQFREGLLWIEVSVAEPARPLNFLVDTGAGVTVVNLTTVKTIGLKLGRTVTVHGVHATLNGHWQGGLRAEIGGVALPQEFLAVDLDELSSACERPVDGLLGADFFRKRVVQIDFAAGKIRLLESLAGQTLGGKLPLRLHSFGMTVPIRVNGHRKQWFRLDTGCAAPLQWVAASASAKGPELMAIGLAKLSIPQTNTKVGLGPFEFESVQTGLHKKSIFPAEAGLLGNGLLSRFSKVTIDAVRGHLYLQ